MVSNQAFLFSRFWLTLGEIQDDERAFAALNLEKNNPILAMRGETTSEGLRIVSMPLWVTLLVRVNGFLLSLSSSSLT